MSPKKDETGRGLSKRFQQPSRSLLRLDWTIVQLCIGPLASCSAHYGISKGTVALHSPFWRQRKTITTVVTVFHKVVPESSVRMCAADPLSHVRSRPVCGASLDLFSHGFHVIARTMRITRPSSKGTTATHATELSFCSPLFGVRTLTLHSVESTESLVYDVLQLNVLHTGRLMIQLARYSRYRRIFSSRKLLTRLMKTLPQPTTGFALRGAHQSMVTNIKRECKR
ncbi:hypothetical protein T265_04968 [Opisthorchis viverrini]|uniref:Uncharacterized protein n=1 Tax=Opisthorchis viverrini TaxID=6198 RepID=A0A074ZLB1_OPIVI|nr:hypothetical protein T265_04968 [Opisthorchis viverrini]KER28133.1 hypothetical protein T265_04968 [Opisthorchis viverrini]